MKQPTILIIGLGNPGKEYTFTRHNIGFRILENWLANLSLTNTNCPCQLKLSKKHQAKIIKFTTIQQKIILAEPQTFMNKSGLSVNSLVNYFDISPNNILLIHDDLSFPLGKLKIDFNVGPAGHNGVKSTIEHLKTKEFCRLRIGISKPNNTCPVNHQGGRNFVLNKFTNKEEELISQLLSTTNEILHFYIRNNCSKTQNKFNNLDNIKKISSKNN